MSVRYLYLAFYLRLRQRELLITIPLVVSLCVSYSKQKERS